jgi:hypothetical protein
MTLDVQKEKQRLAQSKFLGWIKREIGPSERVTVSLHDKADDHIIGIYCALIPNAKVEKSLASPYRDMREDEGLPGAVQYYNGDQEKRVEYHRFGDDSGVEPLVIGRHFHGMREDYREISEEFRHFHRLYHERRTDQYIEIDDAGDEEVVAIIEPNRVQIRMKEIRQFLAIKEMHLAIMFDCRQHSMITLDELGLQEGGNNQQEELLIYGLYYGNFGGITKHESFSRLVGKRLIPPLPKEKSGFWGFAEEDPKKYVDFIIGLDANGNEISHTSNPDQLDNNFDANRGAPQYLTPVHFRKQVLDRYYQQSSKYSVEDGYLRCGGLWGLMMDNHHEDCVAAWLGDLGQSLPYREQLYWRSHNIAPSGGVSETFFRRQMLSQFADSDRPEHLFKQLYGYLSSTCDTMLGWRMLLPLVDEDAHYFDSIRVPSTDEQKEFDDLVLALAKILIDSLNEKDLNRLIPPNEQGEIKGSISRLEKVFLLRGVKNYYEHIRFLRDLQDLRSAGTAHRKGSNYQKIAEKFGVDSQRLGAVFHGILLKANDFLLFLDGVVRSGVLLSRAGTSGKVP